MHTTDAELPKLDPTTHRDWGRLRDAAQACEAGDCRFAILGRAPRSIAGCDGYTGHVYVEHGQLVSRWRICDRRAAWEADQTSRRKAAPTSTVHGTAVNGPKPRSRGLAETA
jgi:hypothetical protein